MKAFALVLLCALAAVQGRYTGLQTTSGSAAALGENPWFVHLRIAVSTSGLLESCAGSLIDNRWVLTAASCIADARFIWIRYGVVNVINPSLVTENSIVRVSEEFGVGLVNINRNVETTDFIAPVPLGSLSVESAGRFCGFGDVSSAGELLSCYDVKITDFYQVGDLTVTGDVQATQYDLGAPLVSDGVQIGVLLGVASDDSVGNFISSGVILRWIEGETGLVLSSEAVPEVAPEAVSFIQ